MTFDFTGKRILVTGVGGGTEESKASKFRNYMLRHIVMHFLFLASFGMKKTLWLVKKYLLI